MNLNESAWQRCARMLDGVAAYGVAVDDSQGARLIDCGVRQAGGLMAGCLLAEICLAGLGRVSIVPGPGDEGLSPWVSVTTDQPVQACIASQYAGWPIQGEKFFAMGSGPMRAVRGREAILTELGLGEKATRAVGILESRKLPERAICQQIAAECGIELPDLTLLIAPTASLAGTVQVVARTVETALHKLHTLGFDLRRVLSGYGIAPLPPVAADDLQGIGRTNDAVLYGGEVTLWIRESDRRLQEIGPQIPSQASRDFGRPFAQIFAACGNDFYKIDPLLFSPAVVTLISLESGRSFRFGRRRPDLLRESFGCESAS